MNTELTSDDGASPRRPPHAGRDTVEIEIDMECPALELRATADNDLPPLARQILRAAGVPAVEAEALVDAELALTEACANAVRHAYPDPEAPGPVVVGMAFGPGSVRAVVRDHGRGIDAAPANASPVGGLGLGIIEAVAGNVEICSESGMGTEIAMELPIDGAGEGSAPDLLDVGRLTRRLLGVGAALSDFTPTQIAEALMAAEIVAREVPGRIVGHALRLRLERDGTGVTLFAGPLSEGSPAEVIAQAEVPGVGSILERLADEVWEVPSETGRASDGEELALRFAA